MDNKLSIFEAIPKIMAEMEPIGKDKTNTQQGFKFRGIDDVYNNLQGLMAKYGVFSAPVVLESKTEERTSKSGGLNIYRILKIQYDFYGSDGSKFSAIVQGEGADFGDKASNKAMAIAHKYALMQVFAIPTEDIDPDATTIEPNTLGKTLDAMRSFLDGILPEDPNKKEAFEKASYSWSQKNISKGERIAGDEYLSKTKKRLGL